MKAELNLWVRLWLYSVSRYMRETWNGIPGHWTVKIVLMILAVAEPGPFGEIALAAFARWNGKRKTRTS